MSRTPGAAAPLSPRGGRSSDAGSAIVKTLRVLEAVSADRAFRPLGELAAIAAVPKPTAHRILTTLVDEGYVLRHEHRGYTGGPRLRALMYSLMGDDDVDAVLADLSAHTGQTTNFGLRSGGEAIYTHKHDGAQPYHVHPNLGARLSLHATAIGKCILAWMPREQAVDLVARTGLAECTDRTITDPERLFAELDEVREHGYAIDDEENEPTIRCLAAPVLGHDDVVLGAVGVSTLTLALDRATVEAFAPDVLGAARQIGTFLRR